MSVGAHLQHMFPQPQFNLKGQLPERSMKFRKDLSAPSTKGPGATTQVCVWGGGSVDGGLGGYVGVCLFEMVRGENEIWVGWWVGGWLGGWVVGWLGGWVVGWLGG